MAQREDIWKWLESHQAVQLWQAEIPGGTKVRTYAVQGHYVLVHSFAKGDGWEAYVMASRSNRVDTTLAALDDAISADRGATQTALRRGLAFVACHTGNGCPSELAQEFGNGDDDGGVLDADAARAALEAALELKR